MEFLKGLGRLLKKENKRLNLLIIF